MLTKCVYLVVYINKLDWPRINDGIFHHVYDMLQSTTWHTVNLGILYVQTLSEVVTAPCSDISVVLYQEQQRVFADHIRYMIRKIFGKASQTNNPAYFFPFFFRNYAKQAGLRNCGVTSV